MLTRDDAPLLARYIARELSKEDFLKVDLIKLKDNPRELCHLIFAIIYEFFEWKETKEGERHEDKLEKNASSLRDSCGNDGSNGIDRMCND